jgi:hypothetical protein
MALPKCEWRFPVAAGGWTFTLIDADHTGTGSTRTISAGDYFHTTINGATPAMTTAMKTALDDGTGAVTYTVSVNDDTDSATGKYTITPSSGTFTVNWISTDLRDTLGFNANITASSGITGSNHALFLWLPDVGRADPLSPEPTDSSFDLGVLESDQTFVKAPDGTSVVLKYNHVYVDTFGFELVHGYKMFRQVEQIRNESLHTNWLNAISKGYPFRYHPDRSSDSLYFIEKIEDGKDFKPVKVSKNWNGTMALYSIAYRMGKPTDE